MMEIKREKLGGIRKLIGTKLHQSRTNIPHATIMTTVDMTELDKLKKEFSQIRNSLRKLRDYVFHFLKDPRVPCHNNDSEGGIRILKVKQKRSGGFRSDSGATDFMAIHSVTDTAKKNSYSQWDAVLALV